MAKQLQIRLARFLAKQGYGGSNMKGGKVNEVAVGLMK